MTIDLARENEKLSAEVDRLTEEVKYLKRKLEWRELDLRQIRERPLEFLMDHGKHE